MFQKYRNSIVSRAALIHALIVVAVGAIVLVSVLLSLRVQKQIRMTLDRDVSDILSSAQLGRVLNSDFAEANLLLTTFPEREGYLRTRQANLMQALHDHQHKLREDETKDQYFKSLERYISVLRPLLDQCVTINDIFKRIRLAESFIEQELSSVDAILVERIIERRPEEAYILQHLGAMLGVYRESLYQGTIHIEAIKGAFLTGQGNKDATGKEIDAFVKSFRSNLILVTTSGNAFALHGEQLLKALDEYHGHLLELVQALDIFQAGMKSLQAAQTKLNSEMESFEFEIAQTALRMQGNVKSAVGTSLLLITFISAGIMIGVLFLTQTTRKLVAPIGPLARRARKIAQGQYAPDPSMDNVLALSMDRHDEIAELARDFEEMRVQVEERENALQESRSVLTATLEATRDGVLVINETGAVSHFNTRFIEIWSIPQDHLHEGRDEGLIDFVLPQVKDPAQFTTEIDRVYESSEISEDTIYLKDGRILERLSYPLIQGSRETGRAWFFRDITKRIELEDTLRKNYLQLQSIYKRLPVILWSVDAEGFFTMSEGKELESLGLQSGQVVGQSLFELYKDFPDIIEHTDKSLKGESCEYVTHVMGHYYHMFHTPFFDDNDAVQGWNGLAINVTETRRTQEEIRHLRNYLANIIDSMPSVLVGVDAKGCITQWNRQAELITGLRPHDVISKPLNTALAPLADQVDNILVAIQERRVLNVSKVSRTVGQEKRYDDITIYPLVANGVEGAVIRVDDVTERVRMEEMMIQSEKMLTLGGLAAGMAHEINNPIAGMLQTTQVMRNRLTTRLTIPANQRAADAAGVKLEAIETFMRQRGIHRMLDNTSALARRVVNTVDNMLSFARKDDVKVAFHYVDKMIDRTIELAATEYDLKKQYDFKRIKIVKSYDAHLPAIPCHESKIQQVLLNILSNGAQAMQTSQTKNPQFDIKAYLDSEHPMVCIEIKDNGPGMTEDIRKQVFDPFFTTKEKGVGTGLGLSVSYFIITENHRGELTVESQPHMGTTFTIRLPLKASTIERAGAE